MDILTYFFLGFFQNLWWGILDGGLSMFVSAGNFTQWLHGAFVNAWFWPIAG
jgi:hypothetical protein